MSEFPKFRPGLGSRAFQWATGRTGGPSPKRRMDPLEFMTLADEFRIKRILITDNMQLEYLPWEAMIRVKRYAGEHGINVNIGTRGMDIDQSLKFLEIAVFIKSPTLLLRPALPDKPIPELSEITKMLHKLLPEFEKEGIKLLLEHQEFYGSEQYAELLTDINHPLLGMSLDPGLSLKLGLDPMILMETLGPWCVQLYFRDYHRPYPDDGSDVNGCVAGEGELNLKSFLNVPGLPQGEMDVFTGVDTPLAGFLQETLSLEREWVKDSIAYLLDPS